MRTTSEIAEAFGLELLGHERLGQEQAAKNRVEISSVAISSIDCQPGSLFIAVQGQNAHGIDFLASAKVAGAVAVLSNRAVQTDLPLFIHPDPRIIAGALSAFVMETLDFGLQIFGVTGTNGKTSTAFYLHQLLLQLGVQAGLSSSAFTQINQERVQSTLTTPEAPRLHWLLAQMAGAGAKAAVIEVSAQALVKNRIDGVVFDVAGFTNLTRDHLDEFGSMENYLAAKALLFKEQFSKRAVINAEDNLGERMLNLANNQSLEQLASIGNNLDYDFEQTDAGIRIFGKQEVLLVCDLGPLMAKNLVLAVVMLLEAGYSGRAIESAVTDIESVVPGRMELVSEAEPHFYLDYAHTPQAVELAARELSEKYPKLVIVLGASGDRDPGKRIEMGRAAAKYASQIVVTDQHPRNEEPSAIRAAIIAGILETKPAEFVTEVGDPVLAISQALRLLSVGGAILWCGPGHLKYREVKGKKLPFDASLEARKALNLD